jgi:hypothetical protein
VRPISERKWSGASRQDVGPHRSGGFRLTGAGGWNRRHGHAFSRSPSLSQPRPRRLLTSQYRTFPTTVRFDNVFDNDDVARRRSLALQWLAGARDNACRDTACKFHQPRRSYAGTRREREEHDRRHA